MAGQVLEDPAALFDRVPSLAGSPRSVHPLPGAAELLAALTDKGVQWAIATSGYRATAAHALGMLCLPDDAPMITRDLVRHAKPDPDLFLAAADQLGVDPQRVRVEFEPQDSGDYPIPVFRPIE